MVIGSNNRELLHRGRRVGDEEKTKIRVVSEEANLILHIETSVIVAENNSVVKPKYQQYTSLNKMLSNFSKVLMAHVSFTTLINNRGIGKGIVGAIPSRPARASISRKRKIHVNEGKYKQRGNTTCAWGRVKDYPKQHFAVVSRNLRCNAYSETLSLKKSSIDEHVKSSKHTNGDARIAKDKKQSQSIMDCVKRQDVREHPSGSILPVEFRLFRFEIVECVISGGIPLSKVDILRPLLEKYSHRLTHSASLREIIPAELEKEREQLLSELESVKVMQLMVLSWQMKKKSLHGRQPTVTYFHIWQV